MAASPSSAPDPADVIATAIGRLRMRRMPRPAGHGIHDAHDAHGARGAYAGTGHDHHHGGPHGRFGGPARLRVLDVLAEASAPLSVGEIGERIGVDQPRASRLVQQCVEFGFVRREADPDDARRTSIALTDDGRAILHRFHGDRRAQVERALASFTDVERAELARLLAKLADGWSR